MWGQLAALQQLHGVHSACLGAPVPGQGDNVDGHTGGMLLRLGLHSPQDAAQDACMHALPISAQGGSFSGAQLHAKTARTCRERIPTCCNLVGGFNVECLAAKHRQQRPVRWHSNCIRRGAHASRRPIAQQYLRMEGNGRPLLIAA